MVAVLTPRQQYNVARYVRSVGKVTEALPELRRRGYFVNLGVIYSACRKHGVKLTRGRRPTAPVA